MPNETLPLFPLEWAPVTMDIEPVVPLLQAEVDRIVLAPPALDLIVPEIKFMLVALFTEMAPVLVPTVNDVVVAKTESEPPAAATTFEEAAPMAFRSRVEPDNPEILFVCMPAASTYSLGLFVDVSDT